jgi:hypothetical protein
MATNRRRPNPGPPHPDPPAGLSADRIIRWFGARQFDAVSRAQLLSAGVTGNQVDGRIRRGLLVPIHRGVFAITASPLRYEGRLVAALLAGPVGAVVSHRSAAALRGMLPPSPGPVHMTSSGPQHLRSGLVVHRSASHVESSTVVNGLPCTTMPRTLVDVAGTHGPVVAERCWTTLAGRRALHPRAIEDEVRRFGRRPGTAVVRDLLERYRVTITGHTRSSLEEAALAMCSAHGLPRPSVNALVQVEDRPGFYEADLLWEEPRVIVELDDWNTHGHPDAFRDNRARDFDLDLVGWRSLRLLRQDVTVDASRTADRLRRLFARRLRELGRPRTPRP